MKQAIKGSLIAAIVVTVAVLAGCGAGDKKEEATPEGAQYRMGEPLTDPAYALIIESDAGNDTLTTEVFQMQFQRFVQQVPAVAVDPAQSNQLRRGIAEEFIRRHLLRVESRQLKLTADQAAVEEQITMIRSSFGSQEELDARLAASGLTMDSLRVSIAEEVVLQQMQEKMVEEAKQPSQQEIDAFRNEQAAEVRAQHILFRVLNPAEKDSVIQKANAVLDSVKTGTDFAALAARHGTDGTRMQGGDLGYFSKGEMVKPFADAAFALSDSGDVSSELVETSFGYHIIRLTGRRTAELMDTTRARSMMMQERQRDAFEAAYDRLREKVVIRVNPSVLQVDLNEPLDG